MKERRQLTIDEVKERVLPVLTRHGAKRAGLFGSVVRGRMRRNSDIDILVDIDEDVSLLGMMRIQRELEEALGRKVDLAEYGAIKPLIRERILDEEVRIL